MARVLFKVKDKYYEWSTISDGIVTKAMTLKELKQYYLEEYGRQGFENDFKQRMQRVEKKGVSDHLHESVEDLIGTKLLKKLEKR